MAIHLTAIIKSRPEHTEEVKTYLLNMALHSKKEEACLQYDLHQNNEEPNIFVFHEIWKDAKGLEEHNAKPYIQDFVKASEALLEENVIIYKTQKIG